MPPYFFGDGGSILCRWRKGVLSLGWGHAGVSGLRGDGLWCLAVISGRITRHVMTSKTTLVLVNKFMGRTDLFPFLFSIVKKG